MPIREPREAVHDSASAIGRVDVAPTPRGVVIAWCAVISALIALPSFAPSQLRSTDRQRAAGASPPAVQADAHPSVPLRLGYVEFDWEPGTIPGFGAWAPQASAELHAVVTRSTP